MTIISESLFRPNLSPQLQFSIRFLLFCCVSFILLEFPLSFLYHPINNAHADIVQCCMQILGYSSVQAGTILTLNDFSIRIIGECSAVFLYVLFTAFVIAFPASFKARLAGLALLGPAIGIANIVRIILVFLAGVYIPEIFDFLHLFLSQVIMISVLLFLCAFWLIFLKKVAIPVGFYLFAGKLCLTTAGLFAVWHLLEPHYVMLHYTLIGFVFSVFNITHASLSSFQNFPNALVTVNAVLIGSFLCLFYGHSGKKKDDSLQISTVSQNRSSFPAHAFIITIIGLTWIGHVLFFIAVSAFLTAKHPLLILAINFLLVLNEWLLPFGLGVYLCSLWWRNEKISLQD